MSTLPGGNIKNNQELDVPKDTKTAIKKREEPRDLQNKTELDGNDQAVVTDFSNYSTTISPIPSIENVVNTKEQTVTQDANNTVRSQEESQEIGGTTEFDGNYQDETTEFFGGFTDIFYTSILPILRIEYNVSSQGRAFAEDSNSIITPSNMEKEAQQEFKVNTTGFDENYQDETTECSTNSPIMPSEQYVNTREIVDTGVTNITSELQEHKGNTEFDRSYQDESTEFSNDSTTTSPIVQSYAGLEDRNYQDEDTELSDDFTTISPILPTGHYEHSKESAITEDSNNTIKIQEASLELKNNTEIDENYQDESTTLSIDSTTISPILPSYANAKEDVGEDANSVIKSQDGSQELKSNTEFYENYLNESIELNNDSITRSPVLFSGHTEDTAVAENMNNAIKSQEGSHKLESNTEFDTNYQYESTEIYNNNCTTISPGEYFTNTKETSITEDVNDDIKHPEKLQELEINTESNDSLEETTVFYIDSTTNSMDLLNGHFENTKEIVPAVDANNSTKNQEVLEEPESNTEFERNYQEETTTFHKIVPTNVPIQPNENFTNNAEEIVKDSGNNSMIGLGQESPKGYKEDYFNISSTSSKVMDKFIVTKIAIEEDDINSTTRQENVSDREEGDVEQQHGSTAIHSSSSSITSAPDLSTDHFADIQDLTVVGNFKNTMIGKKQPKEPKAYGEKYQIGSTVTYDFSITTTTPTKNIANTRNFEMLNTDSNDDIAKENSQLPNDSEKHSLHIKKVIYNKNKSNINKEDFVKYNSFIDAPNDLNKGYIEDIKKIRKTKVKVLVPSPYRAVTKFRNGIDYRYKQDSEYKSKKNYNRVGNFRHQVLSNERLGGAQEVAAEDAHFTDILKVTASRGHGSLDSESDAVDSRVRDGHSRHTNSYYPVVLRSGYLADTQEVIAAKERHLMAAILAATRYRV